MSKIILKTSEALEIARKLNALPVLSVASGKELVDAFLNTVETVIRFRDATHNHNIFYAAEGVSVDEETLTWICVMLEG